MVQNIKVTLEQEEYSDLLQMATDNLRNPSDELRHILRQEINRRKKNSVGSQKIQSQGITKKEATI